MTPLDTPSFPSNELAERLALLEAVHGASSVAAILLDPETGDCLYADPTIERHLGYTVDEYRKGGAPFLAGLLRPGDPLPPEEEAEVRMRHRDGSWRWFQLRRSWMEAEDGTRRLLIVLQDITARREAEERMARTEERFRAMMHHSLDQVAILDAQARLVYSSTQGMRAFGVAAKGAQERTLLDRIHPEDLPEVWEAFKSLLADSKQSATIQLRYRSPGRGWIWTEVAAINQLHNPAIGGILISARDITERKSVENRLLRSEALLTEAQHLAGLGSFEQDLLGQESIWSEGMYRLLDRDPEKGPMSFDELLELIHPSDRPVWAEAPRQWFKNSAPYRSEFQLVQKDASLRHLVIMARLEVGPEGRPEKLLGALQDITARKKDEEDRKWFQERIHRSEKMEAVGQLAGGVAHDFNNHLAAIMGFAGILQDALGPIRPDLAKYAKNIITSCRHSSELTNQLLAFARKGKYLSVLVDLQEIIAEVMQILRHSIDRRITLQCHSDGQPAMVLGDPSQLQSMIMNLALNARDAMPEGGTLTFSTEIRELEEDYCRRLSQEVQPGVYLQVSVLDTGIGMTKDLQLRIFEPFFTTKEPGRGTGLGLASVYGTVKVHRGTILVYSEQGKGSCFKVFLPLAEPIMPGPRDSREVPEAKLLDIEPGSKRVLVVDDEELVGQMLVAQLENLGFQVLLAPDGQDAVEQFRHRWQEIDLVILDMVMPTLSGRDTFHALKAIHPAVQVVLSSGYSLTGDAQTLLDEGVIGFLQKPFQSRELTRILAKAFADVEG
jgi:PAS domain S-box-containing protein